MAMQIFSRYAPWGSEQPDPLPMQKMRSGPVVDTFLNKLKRKRTDSPEPLRSSGEHEVKRKKVLEAHRPQPSLEGRRQAAAGPDTQSQQAPATAGGIQSQAAGAASHCMPPPSTPLESLSTTRVGAQLHKEGRAMEASACPDLVDDHSTRPSLNTYSRFSPLQQIIEHQFNLDILTKHREVRLIDQEMAKCQAALEQLRRCELVPYPGTTGLSSDVSAGQGPSLRPQHGFTLPTAPAPWGVTDGPYTSHYAKWLLPDATFDSTPESQAPPMFDMYTAARADGRSTRNSIVGAMRPGKRVSRDSVSSISKSPMSQAPAPPAPKTKGGPLVIKRMADNKFVKLVCTKCHRGDFSSVQGFLNHCRIAHKLDYKSHEAAAQDCGQPLTDHEQELAATAPPPVGSSVKVAAPPKATAPLPVASRVHAYNAREWRAPPLPRPTWKHQRAAYDQAQKLRDSATGSPVAPSGAATSFHAAPLVASSLTPLLSALFAKRGLGGDLESAAARARETIMIDSDEHEDEDETYSSKASPVKNSASGTTRTKVGSGGQQSVKGHRQPSQRPRPAPLASTSKFTNEVPESPQEHDLSPHTADSNPGLVSDHEDDPVSEPDEDARSVIASSHPISMGRSCEDSMDVDLEVEDEHDGLGVLVRPRSIRGSQMEDSSSGERPRSSRFVDGRE